MYRLGTPVRKRHKIALSLLGVVVLAGLGLFIYKGLHLTAAPQTHIKNAAPITSTYDVHTPQKVVIDEPLFSMDLPSGWSAYEPARGAPVPAAYNFKSVSAEARQLAVYIDAIPQTMALNRVVTVSANGDKLDHATVSDNCTEYTQPTAEEKSAGVADAKWQGVDFLCDIGNYERNVVGTASTEGNNQVTVTGATAGTHKIFLVYTDNGASADYTVFYGIIESFKLK
jgi:hypothetical protein